MVTPVHCLDRQPCFASPQWYQNQSYTCVFDTSMTSPLNQEHGWDEASTSNNQEIVQTTW